MIHPFYDKFSLSLLVDLYELTMAYGYWKKNMGEEEAVFHLFFRRPPFRGGYTIAAGIESVVFFLQNFSFQKTDLEYLATLRGENGEPLFEEGFLKYLSQLEFSCDVDAVCEGEIVFPFEPLIRVKGPILQCQLLESALLTLTNFPSLIATKAARICLAAKEDPVIEFGLRRAPGIDGAITATRSAFIGGCQATSNVLAGKIFNIPVRGTHAHSWIMAFDTEIASFQAYAEAMPNNCIFLVDTYDTLQGVQNAITIGKWLKEKGRSFLGIRLDSGDLTYLSIEARKMLDAAGFTEVKILASNELNEYLIADLKNQGAQIAVWGVGTNLVTGHPQSALDGVYKLSAIRKKDQEWTYKLKLSEQMTKISNPGILQVRRFFDAKWGYVADALYDVHKDISKGCLIIDPFDMTKQRYLSEILQSRDLLQPLFRNGQSLYQRRTLFEIQQYAKSELTKFDRSIKRLYNPHIYPVGMEKSLFDLKIQLVEKIRKTKN